MAAQVGRTPDDLTPAPKATRAGTGAGRRPGSPAPASERLGTEPFAYEFFQAVRILHLLRPEAAEVGLTGPAEREPVRFSALPSTSFPPSAVVDLSPPALDRRGPATMTVSFFGLIGPKGVLPQHYTEMVMRQEREITRDPEKGALRAWFDLFNHRLIGLFYRAWEKYRFFVSYERTARRPGRDPGRDPFTAALLCLIGLGTRGLRERLGVTPPPGSTPADGPSARVDDLALLHYAGILAQRTRNASGLQTLLEGYFGLPIEVRQFQGQWLSLEPSRQSRLGGGAGAHNALGRDVVAGSRVWEIRSKIRLRLGPLSYANFRSFLPDPVRPAGFFALSHLTRFYLGPDLDFDVQLILKRDEVPPCRIGDEGGSVLGWNAWVCAGPPDDDPADGVFGEIEAYPEG